jgi:hypothetical protein
MVYLYISSSICQLYKKFLAFEVNLYWNFLAFVNTPSFMFDLSIYFGPSATV